MKNYKYIIIGGGMTGSAAAKEIRENDPEGTLAMFTKEPFGPYNRPPLSKSLWDGKDIESIVRSMDEFNVDLYLNNEIKEISSEIKTITDEKGEQYKYEKLLLATGGSPIQFPHAPEGVIYYRTLEDYHMLREMAEEGSRFCVIGGGFIGSEIAAALNKQGQKVTMIFPEIGISSSFLPDDLAVFLNDYYREKGVKVLDGNLVESISKVGVEYLVNYKNVTSGQAREETFDGVIVGIGIKPNIQLAQEAGLDVADGIVVNEYLQTSDPDIFAAGDVAFLKIEALGKKMRIEHEDHANMSGAVAGHNMAGEMKKYDYFPFFYSDLFDLGYEALGELNKDFEIFEDWIQPFIRGTISYLDKGQIRGLIFWNLWGKVDQGREIIRQGKTYQKTDLAGFFSED